MQMTLGAGVRPLSVQREPCVLWIPGPPIGLDSHLRSHQRLVQLWTLDLKARCEVWELGARPTECHFYHERGARGCSPQTLPHKLAPGISNWPLTTGSTEPPTRPDPREGSGHQAGPLGPCHTFDVGEYEKLSLSAWPSPVVPLGQTVTLQCHSHSPLERFRLFKRDGKRRLPELQGDHFNNFTLGPVTGEHAGSYTCSEAYWSAPSDPLQIVVSGVFKKPSISAHPGPLVQQGDNVTLRCHSLVMFDKFILHHENSTGHFQRHGEMLTGGYAPADFSIGPMTLVSAGTYRCYGSLRRSPYEWSAPSDPMDIMITGLSKKPSLSAQGGSMVRSGENVTLVCSSESAFDQFHLLREGVNLGRHLAGGQSPRRALQAEFPLGPGTPAHSGVYRCYGSFTRSPYSWSNSSDPLFLSVTEARLPQGHSSQLHLLLRLSVAFIYTSIFLAVLVCHWLPINQGFENLVPFKLSTVGTMWLGSTKRRAEEDNTMRTPGLAQVWTLDMKAQCEVCQLGAEPPSAISIMRGEQEAAPHRPLSYKVVRGLSNQPLTTGSAGAPTKADPRGGSSHQAWPLGPCHRFDVGEYEKPSLSAWPSPVVTLGQTVTLQCHFGPPFVIFRLLKRDGTILPKLPGYHFNTFTTGPVTRKHARSYTCLSLCGPMSVTPCRLWSQMSGEALRWGDSLKLTSSLLLGVFTKPSISAHPEPLMQVGENVTFRFHSSMLHDKFILQEKSSTGHFQRHGEMLTGGHAPADFFIGPMTLARPGTYRCSGSLSQSPYEWSAPSDPVDIIITDECGQTSPFCSLCHRWSGVQSSISPGRE
ncbi:hypothetical protein E5288_WYG021877 [Bos mutus]|uniref:Ig-like domain-containing protein n=1 Tax=Bos mutus TaxID=72004 RepID=A0A6B0SGB4_9CETA|nr:hypothetical protein [Bos mutus]